MSLHRDRILDRLWLALSGAVILSAALQWGAQVGLRPWSAGTPVLAAQAVALDLPARRTGPAAGCGAGRAGGLR